MTQPDNLPLLRFVVDRIEVGTFAVDREMRIILWNRFMAVHSGRGEEAVLGQNLFECFPDLPRKWLEKKIQSVFILKNYSFTSWEHRPYLFPFYHNRPITGGIDLMQQNCTFIPVKDANDSVTAACITLFDYTDTALFQGRLKLAIKDLEAERAEQGKLIKKLEEAHNQLLQSEKMASIGQLAAGVAHEINNPIGFVNSNLGTLSKYVQDLLRLLDIYAQAEPALASEPQVLAAIQKTKQEIDIDFIKEDLSQLISESKDGLNRVRVIVQDLKDFSHVGETDWQWADLHKCLDSTLNVVTNEIKYKAEVIKEYGDIPEIPCIPTQLNQVFMNLLINAVQAISDHGKITISTRREDDLIKITIADTGVGIPAEILNKIFDPFFTTKPIGKGTGLGLSISYSIINKHGGRLEVESLVGSGTTFSVFLPVQQPKSNPDDQAASPQAC